MQDPTVTAFEYMCVNSISYMQKDSKVKNWYVVPSNEAYLVEKHAKLVFSKQAISEGESINQLLAAKTTMMDPHEMAKFGINIYRILRTHGALVIKAQQGYHGSFHNVLNIAEEVNFAISDWLPFEKKASMLYSKQRKESVVAL